jgi:neutrophil cytosolic factor 2
MLVQQIHYQDDVRGMTLNPDTPFEEFVSRLTTKFERSFKELSLKFADEDGTKVTMRDDSDYELALETARSMAKGKPEGKLVIWCTDI